MLKHLVFIGFGVLLSFISFAQTGNMITKKVSVRDTVFLDSLSIVPSTVSIANVDSSTYKIEAVESILIFKSKPDFDSITVTYRTFSIDLDHQYFHKDPSLIESASFGSQNPFTYTKRDLENMQYLSSSLNKNGSISRGVSFGNNQNLSVNSNLNLQLSGKVSDRVNVLAAITDDNIPIQADGNTQQLQEFDKVYIQLFDENHRLTAGDFLLKNNTPYFLKYYKKAQGGRIESTVLTKKDSSKFSNMDVSLSGAISRGKFSRNIIQGVEGNQGPYRLVGADKEPFIIVLSGTERVYIDGKELIRGQENDYVIDYNTAELTFTAKQMITQDKRIVVEFQYSDKNYARSLIQFSDYYSSNKLDLRFDIYSEQDAKNQPLQQDLTDEQKATLELVGDSLQNAIASSVNEVEYSEDLILYKKIDSLGADVYVFSTNPDSAVYQLSFSNVGLGNGSYVQAQSLANGKIFKWVGSGGGSYEPVVLLVAPKKTQMVSLGGEYRLNENTSLLFESALSNSDINTFSKLDKQDNSGYAFKVGVQNRAPIGKKGDLKLISEASYEQVHKNFSFIERFRSVEFFRDWNLRDITLTQTQHLPSASLNFVAGNKGSVNYIFQSYLSGNEYQAMKNNLNFTYNNYGFFADLNNSFMTSKGLHNSRYIRSKGTVGKSTKYFIVGMRDDFERNEFFYDSRDSLLSTSYQFLEWEAYISTPDSAKNKVRLGYTQRENFGAKNNDLGSASLGKALALEIGLLKNPRATLTNISTYRVLAIKDTSVTDKTADSTLLNRLEYNVKLWKGAVVSTSFFEIGSGLEVKKEYTFLKVADGQGVYIHRDNNDNGLAEINEFEIAPNNLQYQANYIKIFVPTNDYIKTFSNQFSQTLMIRPRAVWGSEKSGIKKFIARFSNQLSFLIDRKTNRENYATAYNPFLFNIEDSILVSQNSSFRNTLNFNRSNPKFGASVSYYNVKNKTLLTSGFEQRENEYYSPEIRWNVTRKIRFDTEWEQGKKSASSDFLTARNFSIDYYSLSPKITYQPGTTFRMTLGYELKNKQNESTLNEKADSHTGSIEIKYSTAEKGSFNGNLNFILIDYDFSTNTSLAFEMLEGLQPGQNLTWELIYQRTLANNLQLNLNYNGRWSEGSKPVHVGGVQVRAFF